MVGKFFILAFVCVSLAQVQGETLESAVKSALARLKNIDASAKRETAFAISEVEAVQNLVISKTNIYLKKESVIEAENEANLERTAQLYEKKAIESNKPEETIECIRNAKANTVAQIRTSGPIFKNDILRQQNVDLALIEFAAKPLNELRDSLPERYEKAVAEVQGCKDSESVRKSVDKASRDYNLLFAQERRIRNEVNQGLSGFNREASILFSNQARKVNRIQAQGARQIRNCVYIKSLLEEH